MTLSRRDLLKTGVFAGAALALPFDRLLRDVGGVPNRIAESKLPTPFSVPFAIPPVAVRTRYDATTDYYDIGMRPAMADILPGFRTAVYAYGGSVPGPTIRVMQGREVVVRQANRLPAVDAKLRYVPWTSVHLHGSASLPQYDGYAGDNTRPGEYKDYRYPNVQRARTLWYHDHGLGHTTENVYQGLAAQYHLLDPAERALEIPHGDYDVPLILSDAMFAADGSLLFNRVDDNGVFGDVILVNGRPWPSMRVQRRKYRFRVLNGCVSRSLNYSLDTGDPFTVIATDGGLMPTPQVVRSIRHGMAERYELIIDFAGYAKGQRIVLRNSSPPNNQTYTNTNKIMAFDVTDEPFDSTDPSALGPVPDVLSTSNPVMDLKPSQSVANRSFELKRGNGQWTINGTTWEKVIASGFKFVIASPKRHAVETWTIKNSSGGWFHPFHIHLVDFQILSRNGRPPFAYERGPKDVAYIGEGETVQLLIQFEGVGKYMMHCHNLVHEDHDMMTQFEVVDPERAGDDPFSVPPRPNPAPPL